MRHATTIYMLMTYFEKITEAQVAKTLHDVLHKSLSDATKWSLWINSTEKVPRLIFVLLPFAMHRPSRYHFQGDSRKCLPASLPYEHVAFLAEK